MRSPAGLDRLYAYLFALYSLLFTVVIQWKLPPLMGPDELHHAKRANLLTHGYVVGERVKLGDKVFAGGPCEVNLDTVNAYFEPMEFHPERKLDPAALSKASEIPWGTETSKQHFENTAVYPPFFYLPQSLALWVGKLLGQPILRTLQMARMANAFFCILVGWFAVRIAGRARPLMFAVLLLPMSVALYSSVTQDGALIVTSALGCAFLCRALGEGRPMNIAETIGAAVCLSAVGMAKPPYVLLSLALLLVPTEKPKWRWFATAGAIGLAVAWHLFMALRVATPLIRPDVSVDPGVQMSFLVHHPGSLFTVAWNTMRHSGGEYGAQMVGVLGWLDTLLPKPYYVLAFVVLGVSALLTWSTAGISRRRLPAALLLLLSTTVAIFGGFYIAYTQVGAGQVEGVQGRYLLPMVAMLPLAFAGSEPQEAGQGKHGWTYRVGTALILLFPIISMVVVEHALTARYY